MKCRALGCKNEIPESVSDLVCGSCVDEMDRLLREEMAKRLGRPPTEREVEDLLERCAARRVN